MILKNVLFYFLCLIKVIFISCALNEFENFTSIANLRNSLTRYLYLPRTKYIKQRNLLNFHEFSSDSRLVNKNQALKIKQWIEYLHQNNITSFIEKNSNELVVFMHGFGSNLAFSIPANIALSLKNIPTLTYDLLGSGKTEEIGNFKNSYKLEYYCDQLWDLLKHIGWLKDEEFQNNQKVKINKNIKKLFIIGASLGATIAATCSAIDPEKITAVFLSTPIETMNRIDLNNFPQTKIIAGFYENRKRQKLKKVSFKNPKTKFKTKDSKISYLEHIFYQLSNTDVHTLFFWGHNDPFIKLSQNINMIKKYFPNSKLAIYCDNDHLGYFNEAIFLFDIVNAIYEFTLRKKMELSSREGYEEEECKNFPIYTKITEYYNRFPVN